MNSGNIPQEYSDIINLIYVAQHEQDPTEMRYKVLPLVASMFRTERAIFFLADEDFERIDPSNQVTLNIDKSIGSTYARQYWQLDPVYQATKDKCKVVFRNHDLLPRSYWLQLRYYIEFQKPQHIGAELCICLRSGDTVYGMIDLLRSEQEPSFDDEDVSRANLIARHIGVSLRNALCYSRISHERELLSSVLELSSHGIVILDHRLRPVYCNYKGKEILCILCDKSVDEMGDIEIAVLPIHPEIITSCMSLKKNLQHGDKFKVTPRLMNTIVGRGESYLIECVIISQYTEASPPLFLISIKESETRQIGEAAIDEYHHLTQRELEIAQYLVDGMSNKQIAEELYISPLTVETHLKRVYRKMGVTNRTELASKLYSLSIPQDRIWQ